MDRVIAAAPPIVPELFDKDIMDMMVNVRGPRGTSLSDVVALLQHQGISVQEIEAISDRGPRHGGHMIQLKTTAAVEKISLIHRYYFRNKHFTVCPLDKQVVEVRLHWLPLYLGEKFVRSLFTEHGKVLSVERVENTVAQVQVKTGVLRVEVEVTEQQRANIPHLIQFGCGMTTLITMPGRPPLCLRCNRIGHMRRDCQAGTFPSSFAGIVKATPVPVTPEPEESVATQGLQPTPEAQQSAPSGPAPPSQIPTPETETSTPEVEAWPVEEEGSTPTMPGRSWRYLAVIAVLTVALYMYISSNFLTLNSPLLNHPLLAGHGLGQYTTTSTGGHESLRLQAVDDTMVTDESGAGASQLNTGYQMPDNDGSQAPTNENVGTSLRRVSSMNQEIYELYKKVFESDTKAEILSNATIVLIVAYMRTGSTLTGSLFQEYPGNFYAFEPIRSVSDTFKRAHQNNSPFATLKYIFEDRNYSLSEKEAVVENEVKQWLSCRLKSLSLPTLKDRFHQSYTRYMRTFRACVMRLNTASTLDQRLVSPQKRYHECLDRVINICKIAPAIVLKFIRLRMKTVLKLIPHFPNMKVIHLMRDPRGMFNSRRLVPGGDHSMDNQFIDQFCQTLAKDLSVTKLLQQIEPSKLKIVQYEDLAESPMETAKEMFAFAGLEFGMKMERFMKHMTSSSRDSCKFCTQRKNSTATASKWRTQMKIENAKYIYDRCNQSMKVLGYLPFQSAIEMKNLYKPSRVHHNVSEVLYNDEHF